MPDQMNPSLSDLDTSTFQGALAADPTLGQTAPGLGAYMGHVAKSFATPLYNLIFGPQSPGANIQRGMAGDIPTTEEQVPWAAQTALNMAGGGAPAAERGALGAAGGKLTQSQLERIAERAEARSAGEPIPPRVTTPEGAAIKGRPFTKRSQETLKQLEQEPTGTGPMDLSTQEQIPNVAQRDIERYDPNAPGRRGVSPRMQRALANPEVRAGVLQSIRDGMGMGAHRWYHTEPVRQAFQKAYAGSNSDPGGAKAFRHFMDLVAATSPRSDVPTNIRNATYYFGKSVRGEEIPDKLPYPYGHLAQKQHVAHARRLSAAATTEEPGWNPLQHPKPATFSENLQGNLQGVTVDTHAFRNIGMRTRDPEFLETQVRSKIKRKDKPPAAGAVEDELEALGRDQTMIQKYGEITIDKNGDQIVTYRPRKLLEQGRISMDELLKIPAFWASKPNENEYMAAENLWRELAKEVGLAPGDAQAAGWAGGGRLTGLGSPPAKTFSEMMNERVEYTARMRGEDPQQTLLNAILGKVPLLSLGGLAAGAAAQQGLQPREGM